MSHILDALRKAQDETVGKPKKSVVGGEALIAHRSAVKWGGITKRVWMMAGSGVLLLAVVAWFLYGSSKPSTDHQAAKKAAEPPPVAAVAPAAVTPPAAVMAPPPVPSATTAAVQPTPPQPQPANTEPNQATTPVQEPPTTAAQSEEGDEEGSSPRRRKNRRNSAASSSTAAKSGSVETTTVSAPTVTKSKVPETISTGTLDGIKLTGIAWQEKRSMRRAVVNDVLMGEGTMVAGAKVLEIRPAMVRFEKNGTIFEVSLPR